MTGSALADLAPNEASQAQSFPFLPSNLRPHNCKGELVPRHQRSDLRLRSERRHLAAEPRRRPGARRARGSSKRGRANRGRGTGRARSPRSKRYAEMLSGVGVKNADGSEWYFPERLTIDTGAVGNGHQQPGPDGARRARHPRHRTADLAAHPGDQLRTGQTVRRRNSRR